MGNNTGNPTKHEECISPECFGITHMDYLKRAYDNAANLQMRLYWRGKITEYETEKRYEVKEPKNRRGYKFF